MARTEHPKQTLASRGPPNPHVLCARTGKGKAAMQLSLVEWRRASSTPRVADKPDLAFKKYPAASTSVFRDCFDTLAAIVEI